MLVNQEICYSYLSELFFLCNQSSKMALKGPCLARLMPLCMIPLCRIQSGPDFLIKKNHIAIVIRRLFVKRKQYKSQENYFYESYSKVNKTVVKSLVFRQKQVCLGSLCSGQCLRWFSLLILTFFFIYQLLVETFFFIGMSMNSTRLLKIETILPL